MSGRAVSGRVVSLMACVFMIGMLSKDLCESWRGCCHE